MNDYKDLIPKDKHDVSGIGKLMLLSDEEIEGVVSGLLNWIQDMNWPVAKYVIKVLGVHKNVVEKHLLKALKVEQKDAEWKKNIIRELLYEWSLYPSDELVLEEIRRIANNPTNEEKEELVDEAARTYLEDYKNPDNITTVIFVRHAKSVYGEDDRNRPLSEEGIEDSKTVLKVLNGRNIDVFMCSPYKRSMDTIKEAADYYKINILVDERLRERKCGSYDSESLKKRWNDFTYAEENGECLKSVQDRNTEALGDILTNYKGKTIVIGTHGTALSTILNKYNSMYDYDYFLRIVNWMPYVVEAKFSGDKLIKISEIAYVNKEV